MMKKILIVDDEPELIALLTARLEANGYQVGSASNGEEGLRKAKEMMPDVIILDILMPVMDGVEMGEVLKEDDRTCNIPIIFLTALFDKKEEERAGHRIGGHYFLAKPYDVEELLRLIVQATNRS